MNEIAVELLGGGGALIGAILYSKWQAAQNAKEIEDLKVKIADNETKDNAREVKIAVLEQSLTGLEREIKAKLEAIETMIKELKQNYR